jgi:DNA modification methylase
MAQAIEIGANYSCVQVVNLGLVWREQAVLPYWDHYIEAARRGGHKLLSWNVWHKTGGMSIGALTSMFTVTHEWLFVFGAAKVELCKTQKNKSAGAFCAVKTDRDVDGVLKEAGMARKHPRGTAIAERRRLDSVIALTQVQNNEDHPATFPVELSAQFLVAFGDLGPVVDPFLGSGTTLIACEQLDRTCYGIEIEPRYVDVAVQRWENLTGGRAEVVDERAGEELDLLS